MKTSNPNILSRIPRQQLWGFYIKLYSGGEPEFIEGDVFRTPQLLRIYGVNGIFLVLKFEIP